MEDLKTFLQTTADFASLSCATRTQLAQVLLPRVYPAGEIIQLEGEECRGIFWVAAGEVDIFRSALDGRELRLSRLSLGQAFNIVPPFEEPSLCRASARAAATARLWLLTNPDLLRLLPLCPDLSMALLKRFAAQLGHLNRLVEQIALHSVRGRLARFLLDQANGKLPAQPLTQDEMAEQLGTVRDMIGRTLRSFEETGLIRRERSRILLRDRAGLEEEAAH